MTPTLFPRREFEKAVRLQPILNELMHWVAHDTEFLRETLANTIQVDEFTGKLFKIYERVLTENGDAQVIFQQDKWIYWCSNNDNNNNNKQQ